MPYKTLLNHSRRIPLFWRIGLGLLGWLVLISLLHYRLNCEAGQRKVLRMGYMPVITNLACPLLDYASKEGNGVRFSALKFAAFAEMAEALRSDKIQAAFMIAPLSIVLRQQGEDVKIIYIGNRHESSLVVNKDLGVKRFRDLAGKTVAVPMRYSGHNISIMQLMQDHGLAGRIRVVEMNPPDMAAAMATGSLDAYYVGEPFAAQTVKSGHAKLLFHVEDVWKNFICNLLLVKQSFIENDPDLVARLVQGAARSGLWAAANTAEAAEIAAQYWNQPVELVAYALSTPPRRVAFDQFTPQQAEIQSLTDLMLDFKLIEHNRIEGLVEDRFARSANLEGITDFPSILQAPDHADHEPQNTPH